MINPRMYNFQNKNIKSIFCHKLDHIIFRFQSFVSSFDLAKNTNINNLNCG